MSCEAVDERLARMRELRADGKSLRQIAATFGLSRARISQLLGPGSGPDERRRGRHRDVRATTININRQTKAERIHLRIIHPDAEVPYWRPTTRADCDEVRRPCPYVGCQHNLYLDVSEDTGAIKLNFPDLEPDEMPANGSCAADLAEHGGLTLEEAGEPMNVTRERIRQIESRALRKLDVRIGRQRQSLKDYLR